MQQELTRREFLQGTLAASLASAVNDAFADEPAGPQYDVIVIGGTPGGIAAAVAAARLGRFVALVEYHKHLGGMSASGLGKSDIEKRELIRGFFAEFVTRVREHYVSTYGPDSENVRLCHDGYYYEPSVAEAVFESFLAEQPGITVLRQHRLESVLRRGSTVTGAVVQDRSSGANKTLLAKVIIDATYEGDAFAAAGAKYRQGREGRKEFGEPHAGFIYFDWNNQKSLEGTTGRGDDRLQAYTYRLCLTTDPENSHRLTEPPPDYDRARYLGYFDDLNEGRLAGPKNFKPGRGYNPAHFNTLMRALSVTDLPNRKTDVNMNPRALAFPFVEENAGYLDGGWAERERICTHIRNLTLGLVWFLQNDSEVPAEHRALAAQYHFPLDEFEDNGHFPFQLYVREGRRLVGLYTLSERDVAIVPEHESESAGRFDDAIAVGEFPIDSFPVHKKRPGDTIVLEGYLGLVDSITRPYQIPYRIMVPETIDGLLVPVAASTTHVAYSTIRMEPTWMALGQAAGIAAHVAIDKGTQPRNVPVSEVQRLLREANAVIDLPA